MSQTPYSIQVRGIQKRFGTHSALNDLTMAFSSDVMHGIIGPEGAGKTTLMRIILGLLKPDFGSVDFIRNGERISFAEIRTEVAYMPQQQSLYPDLSIGEHLDFFKELYGVPDRDYQDKRKDLLHLTRLTEFVTRPAGKLSGGMYKKLGLMCALLRSPRVMLLDEPTNGVDTISRREFWELLYRLMDQEILIIMTTAYMDEVERCGVVHLMQQGRVVAEGEPRTLLEHQKVDSFEDLFMKEGAHE